MVASVKIQSVDNAFFDAEADVEVPIPETGRRLVETRPTVVYNFSGIPHPIMVQGNKPGGLPNSNNQMKGGPGNGGQRNQWKGQKGQNMQANNWKPQGPSGQQRQGPIICYGCGQPGHIKRQWPHNQVVYTSQPNQKKKEECFGRRRAHVTHLYY